jgi:steroid delta-isomerase-like uncharacterized protein
MSTQAVSATDVVERWFASYNAQDFDAMEACLAPDVDFQHFNRGFAFTTADELMATLRAFAADYMPDRNLGPALRTNTVGNVVYREQLWTGTLAVDLPGFGSAGDAVSERLCTVFTVGEDGRITEYYDYG